MKVSNGSCLSQCDRGLMSLFACLLSERRLVVSGLIAKGFLFVPITIHSRCR
jgi:hypothetical protein